MSIDRIMYIPLPVVHEKPKQIPYIDKHQTPQLDPVTGLHLTYGNGCHKYPNCFDCPFPPERCYYNSAKPRAKLVKPPNKPNGGKP